MEYGSDGSMNFKGEIFNEKLKQNDRKLKVIYSFDVRDKETFTLILEAFSNKSASTIIRCETKAQTSYSGRIIELKKEDLDNE